MEPNLEKLKLLARDLRKEEPRYGGVQLAGFDGAARALDKCRASLLGWQGDYMFGCPLDQMFFQQAGIDQEEFRNLVATGASDGEVEEWLRQHAKATK